MHTIAIIFIDRFLFVLGRRSLAAGPAGRVKTRKTCRYATCEWNVCELPHSRQMKCTVSRRAHGFGDSQTAQSVSAGRRARSELSQASGRPAAFASSSQLTSLQIGQRQQTAI